MRQYHELIRDVLAHGRPEEAEYRQDRTGVGTWSVFGRQMRFNLAEGFPLVTTKRVHLKSIIHELIWFLRGETNTEYLHQHGITIWDEWADSTGELGPIYGKQWRRWESASGTVIDQLGDVVTALRKTPTSRRLLVVAYNPGDLPEIAPPACHTLFQFYTAGDKLSLQLYQRSADLMLGVPFNIASYSLLLMMVAQVTGFTPHEFIHTFGDVHIYANHLEAANLQIQRELRPLPTVRLNPEVNSLFEFTYNDFTLEGYDPHPAIKLPIAV